MPKPFWYRIPYPPGPAQESNKSHNDPAFGTLSDHQTDRTSVPHRKVGAHLYWDHYFYKLSPAIPEKPSNLRSFPALAAGLPVAQGVQGVQGVQVGLDDQKTRLQGFYQLVG